MDNNELYHHGILGMKWGIRRTPAQLGHTSKSKSGTDTKSESKSESSTKSTPKKKTVKEMSDEELREKISRLELEKRYNDLSPKTVSKGEAFTKRVVNNMVIPAAEDVGKQLIKSALTGAVNKALSSKNVSEEYKIYTNNKKKS